MNRSGAGCALTSQRTPTSAARVSAGASAASTRAAACSAAAAYAVVCVNLSMSPASIQPPVRSNLRPSCLPPTTTASSRCAGPCTGDGSLPSLFAAK
jgi:hypothetical protein